MKTSIIKQLSDRTIMYNLISKGLLSLLLQDFKVVFTEKWSSKRNER